MTGISVTIGADTEGLEQGVKRSKQSLGGLSDEMKRGIATAAKYGAAAAAAGAAIAAGLVVKGLKAVDSQAKLARQLSATIDGLRAAQIAASDAGIATETLNNAAAKLNQRMGEAQRGTGEAADAFKMLGLNARAMDALDVDERFALIADRVEELGLSTSQTADVMRRMGIEQTELVNLMTQGGDAIRAARVEVDELGLSLSAVDAAKVEIANDSFARTGLVIDSITQRMAVEFAPILDTVSKMLVSAGKNGTDTGDAIAAGFDFAVKSIGFVMNGIDLTIRNFKFLFNVVKIVAQGIQVALLEVADAFVNEPVKAINELIGAMNAIPGVDIEPVGISGFGQGIRDELAAAKSATVQTYEDIKQLFTEPLLGTEFVENIEAAKAAAQEAAERQVAGGGRDGEEVQPLNFEQRLEKAQEEHEIIKEKKEKNERELINIERKAALARQKIAEQEAQAKQKGIDNFYGNLISLTQSKSKTLFNIGKAAALANAVVDGYAAITGAYKVGARIGGPPVGAAFAAAAGAATFAQIQSIRSQQFNGGGGGGSAPSGGGGAASASAAAATAQPQQAGPAGGTLTVQGLSADSLLTGDAVAGLANELLEYQRRGGTVVLAT